MFHRHPLLFSLSKPRIDETLLYSNGCLSCNPLRELQCSVDVCPHRHNLLHQANAMRVLGSELLRSEQETHRVPPPNPGGRTERRAPEWEDSSSYLQLAEPDVVCSNNDVGRQGKLDGEGESDSVDGHDHRLWDGVSPHPKGVIPSPTSQYRRPLVYERGPNFSQIQTGTEVISMPVKNTDAKLGVTSQLTVCEGQLLQHLDIDCVVFLGPIEANYKNVLLSLAGNVLQFHELPGEMRQ